MRRFKLKVIVLLVLILVVLCLLSYFLIRIDFMFTQIVLTSILILLIFELFRTVDYTNKSLSRFIFSLRFHDFSNVFTEMHQDISFKKLNESLNIFLEKYKDGIRRIEEIEQRTKLILDTLPIGICIASEKKIEFVNDYAKKLVQNISPGSFEELKMRNEKFYDSMVQCEQGAFSVNFKGVEYTLSKSRQNTSSFNIYTLTKQATYDEDQEMEAWQKLIKVLTHEMVNSVTVISSLAKTANEINNTNGDQKSIDLALDRIINRSDALLEFVKGYQKVTQIPLPNKIWFDVKEMLISTANEHDTEVSIEDRELKVEADRGQVEQVVNNLILNAKEAIKGIEGGKITLKLYAESKVIVLQVIDNGIGIKPAEMNQIFIPFYSTRANGNGIGLPLSRQMMRNNGGTVSLRSSKKGETIFELRF